jgi:hypothetical protein
MNRRTLAAAAAGALGIAVTAGALWAQAGFHKPASRAGIARRPSAVQGPRLGTAQASARTVRVIAALTGIIVLFDYNPNLTVQVDVDGDGSVTGTGDRTIFQGTLWLSNRNGSKIRELGEVASVYDYLDVSGETTGTDAVVTHDLRFSDAGQVRAGGFWNVDDFIDAPTVGVNGATGSASIRRYRQGQLVFLATAAEDEELYLLAR